jgi:hypothetical protein
MKWGCLGPSSSLFPEVDQNLGLFSRKHWLVLARPLRTLKAHKQATEAKAHRDRWLLRSCLCPRTADSRQLPRRHRANPRSHGNHHPAAVSIPKHSGGIAASVRAPNSYLSALHHCMRSPLARKWQHKCFKVPSEPHSGSPTALFGRSCYIQHSIFQRQRTCWQRASPVAGHSSDCTQQRLPLPMRKQLGSAARIKATRPEVSTICTNFRGVTLLKFAPTAAMDCSGNGLFPLCFAGSLEICNKWALHVTTEIRCLAHGARFGATGAASYVRAQAHCLS